MRNPNLIYKLTFICILLLSINPFTITLNGQSLSTGTPVLEDYYRREQLLGNIAPNFSFVSYPLFPVEAFKQKNIFLSDTSFFRPIKIDESFKLGNGKFIVRLLPVLWQHQYDSHHPESINDGSMIPARGYQTSISTGFYFKYSFLSLKIQPEFVHAANINYEGFPRHEENPELEVVPWYMYYKYYLNYIDAPERFGDNAYNQVFWGQSSIRFTYNAISLGFSTENLWWGPGMKNSLIMTNTAPGFGHFTLNTVKPVKTIIGSFEGQIIAGTLKSSGYFPPNHLKPPYLGLVPFYIPKPEDSRYINAMILSYQPKWVPGLFIGFIKSFQTYKEDLKGAKLFDYLPIFSPLGKKVIVGGNEKADNKKLDPYYSLFFRYMWPESHVEIYGEIGRSEYYWNLRDLIVDTEYSNAYNFGFRKLIPLNNHYKDYFQVNLEFTQLARNASTVNRRGGGNWGIDEVVKDGYTNKGQFLGSGIGPGSNLQTFKVSWFRSLKMIGIQFERYAHNEDYFFTAIHNYRSHWIDLDYSLLGNWNYKNFLFVLELKAVKVLNYQWEFNPEGGAAPTEEQWWAGGKADDFYNYHAKLSVIYRF